MQQYLDYTIRRCESVTRWIVTDVRKEYFESPKESFYAPVNMGEGYVQIVYPVRKAFLKTRDIRSITRYEGKYDNVYFPFENTRVDFSTFIHTPHILSVNARTFISTPDDDYYEFAMITCGAVKLWIDEESVLEFAPYNRNIAEKKVFKVHLSKGMHKLEVYADDLAERDVFFFFELRYLGESPIQGLVEVEEDPAYIKRMEAFLKSLYLLHGTYEDGDLEIFYDGSLLEEDTEVKITGTSDLAVGGKWAGKDSFTAYKDKSSTVIAKVSDCPSGGCTFSFHVDIGRYTVSRKTFFSITPSTLTEKVAPDTIEERKAEARDFIYGMGDEHIMRAMVMMRKDGFISDEARRFINISLKKIKDKADCADFVLVPMLWSIMQDGRLYDDALYGEIKKAILDFRYWIDEPGNDVMWYFSENHAFLFHVAEYLAGYHFENEIFTQSGRTGAEQKEIGYARLIEWFGNFNKYHYAEWNSATYLPIDLIGLFTLYEVAPDEDIRSLAKEALDYTFHIIENNTYRGIMASSYGRCYEKTLKSRTEIETNFLSWVAFGKGRLTSSNRATALMCLSSYAPEAAGTMDIEEGKALTVKAKQGLNPVYTYLYKTNGYSMGSTIRFKCFKHGHQQHVFDLSFGKKNRQFFINHPGERAFSGENRPSYWAGNGTCPMVVQYKGLSMMFYDIDEEEMVHYIHTWSPVADYDEYRFDGKFAFFRIDESYVAAYFSQDFTLTTKGINAFKEIISQGLRHFVFVRVSNRREAGSFDDFIKKIMAIGMEYDLEKHKAALRDFKYGKIEISENETRVNGVLRPDIWEDELIKEDY